MPRLPFHLVVPCLLLTACGQTGNLYLPDHGKPPSEQGHKLKTTTTSTPAPSTSTDAPPGSTPESFDEKKKEKRDAAAAAAKAAPPAPVVPVTPAEPATTP